MMMSAKLLLVLGLCASAPNCSSVAQRAPAVTIVIDPGHPSETSAGNERQNGTTEIHMNWLVALALRDSLRARGYEVLMTKASEAELVTNRARAELGNRAHAALMVRLHCDASSDSGFALYYPDRQGTVAGRTGPTEEVMRRSAIAAESLHAGIAPVLLGKLKDGGVRGDSKTFVGSRQGALTGSIFSEIPVVLIEMVTLSNARDAAFITSEGGRQLMAGAIAAGVGRYLSSR
jgi:N-acetylmuramoyl-L-alanine amidase